MADYEKLDHWSLRAQKEGYPARSVYKLKEMDEKFGLFKGAVAGIRVLDLGAAPGSWSLYALRKMGSRGFLAARTLAPCPEYTIRDFSMLLTSFSYRVILRRRRSATPFFPKAPSI